ncbi:MAG: Holliday junction resolvase RuvX [Candidatus Doudnabacteria bacterium]|nr:Holliday junction resolvase RuvX [Candidatus Doudnabacteria bacterium]
MRILGIDYGTKRVGLAISDELGLLARELDIVSPVDFFRRLPGLIKEYEIESIVLGVPLNMSGQDTDKTKEVRAFQQSVEEASGVPVHGVDERLSSQMAQRISGSATNLDSLAAQIILQNYLNQQTSKLAN